MDRITLIEDGRANGYGTCWYCGHATVDPREYIVRRIARYRECAGATLPVYRRVKDAPDEIQVCDTARCVRHAESDELYA